MRRHCPYCGRVIESMTPLKAAIFRAIKAAGDVGISSHEIILTVFRGRPPVNLRTIKAHVWQINELLEDSDIVIVSDRRRWTLERRNVREVV